MVIRTYWRQNTSKLLWLFLFSLGVFFFLPSNFFFFFSFLFQNSPEKSHLLHHHIFCSSTKHLQSLVSWSLTNYCPWEIIGGERGKGKGRMTVHSKPEIWVIENISIDFLGHMFNRTVRFSGSYKEKTNAIVLRISDQLFILTACDFPSLPLWIFIR